MTNTMQQIAASCATTDLERAALDWLNEEGSDHSDGVAGAARDLFRGGCKSGIVADLIYTSDCLEFVREHLADILELLRELADETGEEPKTDTERGHRWGADWLAWIAFEEAAQRVCERAGVEL
jgi:hypothetical protein